jgi:hypothetical protein
LQKLSDPQPKAGIISKLVKQKYYLPLLPAVQTNVLIAALCTRSRKEPKPSKDNKGVLKRMPTLRRENSKCVIS